LFKTNKEIEKFDKARAAVMRILAYSQLLPEEPTVTYKFRRLWWELQLAYLPKKVQMLNSGLRQRLVLKKDLQELEATKSEEMLQSWENAAPPGGNTQ
jgi:hypothetical protein